MKKTIRSTWVSTNLTPVLSFLIHDEHINTQEDTTTNKNSSSYICRGDVLSYPELPINSSTCLAAVALAVRPRVKHLRHHPHRCSLRPAVAPLHRPCCHGDDGEGGQDQKQHSTFAATAAMDGLHLQAIERCQFGFLLFYLRK